ncbi:MAG: hypothetical protein Q9181_005799 [Wetmoreana brouardii]
MASSRQGEGGEGTQQPKTTTPTSVKNSKEMETAENQDTATPSLSEIYPFFYAGMRSSHPSEPITDRLLDDWRFQTPITGAEYEEVGSALRLPLALFELELGTKAPAILEAKSYAEQWTALRKQFVETWNRLRDDPVRDFGVLRKGNGKKILEWQDGNVYNVPGRKDDDEEEEEVGDESWEKEDANDEDSDE